MLELIKLEKKNDYNKKIDHRFIQHLTPKIIYPLAIRKDETSEFSKKYNAYIIFKKATLTLESLISICKVFKVKLMPTDQTFNEIKKVAKSKDIDKIYDLLCKFIENQVFGTKTREISYILFNKLVVDKGYLPIIFYRQYNDIIYKLIKKNEKTLAIMGVNQLAHLTNEWYNQKRKLKSIEEVKEAILNNKEFLEINYKISSIGIYGSLAKGNTNPYSDLDIWFKTSEEIDLETKDLLKITLANLLELTLDVTPFEQGVTEQSRNLFESSITIF